jgi:hypothetical protein
MPAARTVKRNFIAPHTTAEYSGFEDTSVSMTFSYFIILKLLVSLIRTHKGHGKVDSVRTLKMLTSTTKTAY